jgi:hypothetical protein
MYKIPIRKHMFFNIGDKIVSYNVKKRKENITVLI